eukprot:gene7270-14819_t
MSRSTTIAFVLWIRFSDIVTGFQLAGHRSPRTLHCLSSSLKTESPNSESLEIDLTGYKLWCTFTGFGVDNMNNALELKAKSQVEYSRGITASAPGNWRVVKVEGKDVFEATHPVQPEHMFFFDIWEPTILWRGTVDMQAMKIINGEVITNKRRFGIIPYTETLATFTANILRPDESLPAFKIPRLEEQQFVAPVDFESPYDMKRYPEIFDPEFVDWWFDCEEALAKGEAPPPRPKTVFTPLKGASSDDSSSGDEGDTNERLRRRRGPTAFFFLHFNNLSKFQIPAKKRKIFLAFLETKSSMKTGGSSISRKTIQQVTPATVAALDLTLMSKKVKGYSSLTSSDLISTRRREFPSNFKYRREN